MIVIAFFIYEKKTWPGGISTRGTLSLILIYLCISEMTSMDGVYKEISIT